MANTNGPVVLVVAPGSSGQVSLSPQHILGRMPNMGILYLAGALEANGYTAVMLDRQHDSISPFELAVDINAHKPALVGFTLYDITVETTRRVISVLRMVYKGPIVVGGYTPTFHAEDILRAWPDVDYVVLREGEEAIVALMEHIQGRRAVTDVPNLVYREGDTFRYNPQNNLVDVTKLPWPKRVWPEQGDVTPIISRRGCLSRCAFCSMVPFYDVSLGPKVRQRPAADVAEEIAYCIANGGTDFMFYDDDFGLSTKPDRDWCVDFMEEVRKRDLKFDWGIELRVADVVRGGEILRELIDIGLNHISIGMESLLPRQLKLYNKGYKQEDVFKAIEIAKTLPIDHQTNVIFWDPWLTIDEAVEHVDLLYQIQIQEQLGSANFPFFANVLRPRRGTQIYSMLLEARQLRLKRGSFCDFRYQFVDPETAAFHDGAHQEFLARARSGYRPPALWLMVPKIERDGFVELGKAYRTYARAIANTEFDYFAALIKTAHQIKDKTRFDQAAQEIHEAFAPRIAASLALIPDDTRDVMVSRAHAETVVVA